MIEPSDIEIRTGREADLAGIAEVLVATWRTTFRALLPDDFLDAMSPPVQAERHRRRMRLAEIAYVVAEDRRTGALVGFANSGPSRLARMPYSAELYALYVLKDHQRAGLGRKLVTAAAADALSRQRRSMLVMVLAGNLNRRFYSRLGAVPVGREPVTLAGAAFDQVCYAWDDLASAFHLETV